MRVYIIPSFVLSLLVVLATLSTAISAANSHTSKSSFLFKQFDDEVSTTQNNNKQQNAVDQHPQQQRNAVELSNNGPSSPTPAPSTTVSPSLNNITWETINSCATTSGENENDCSIQAASDLPSHSYAAYKIPLDVSTSDLRNIDIVVNLQDDAICEESVYVEWKLKEVPSLLPWTITHDGSTGDEGAPDLFRALLILPLEKSLMCNTRPDIQKSFQGIDPSQEQALYVLVQSRRTASSPDWPPAPSDNSSTTTTPAPTTLYPGHHHTEAPPGSRCAVNVYVNIRKTSVWRTHAYLIIFSAAAIFFLTPMFIILNLLLARRDGQHHLYLFPLRRLMYVNVLMFFPSVIFFYTTKLITTTVTKAHECGRKNKCCVACCCPRNRIKRRTNVSGSSNGSNNSGNSMTNLEGQPQQQQQPSNNTNHQEEEEEIVCRICFDGDEEEDLLQPCNCTGSAAYIHQSCLDKWRVQSSNQRVQRAASCEICLAPFRIPVSRAAVFKMVALRVLYLVVFFASAYGIITVNFLFEAFAISPMTCTAPYESSFTGPLSNIQTYVVGALTYLVVAYAIYVATQITWMIWFNVATPFERDPRDEEAQNNNPAEENLLGGENNNNNNNENNNNDGVGAVAVNVGAARNNGNDDEDDERQELLGNNNNNVQNDNNNDDNEQQQQPRHSPRENNQQQEQEAPPARQEVAANNNNNNNNNDDENEHNHNHHQENEDPILAPPNLIAPEDENDNQEGNNNNNNNQQNNENNNANDNNNIDVVPENIRRIRDYAERQRARPVTSFFHSWKVLFLVIYFLFWQFCGVVLLCFLYKWIIYNHRSDFAWSWGIPFPAMIIIVMFITLAILVVAVLRALAQRCIHAERRETDRIAAENRQEEQDERDIAEEQQAQQQQQQQQQQNQEVEAQAPQVAVD